MTKVQFLKKNRKKATKYGLQQAMLVSLEQGAVICNK